MHKHIVRWMVAVVTEQAGNKLVTYGYTHDITLDGATVFTDRPLSTLAPEMVEIRIPRGKSIDQWVVIEVKCRNLGAVLEEDHFRNQLQFLSFTGDGRQVLENALRERGASMEAQ